jgi:two-component system sensor kinase FixL
MNFTLSPKLWTPERFAGLIALSVILIALAAVIGWQTGSVFLIAVLTGSVALQPSTAIALIVGGAGLAAAAAGQRWAARGASVVLLAACALWLWADATQRSLPLDLLLNRAPVLAQSPAPIWPGRPSVITCAVIALFAASLLGVGVRSQGARKVAVVTASLGALLATLSLLPYAIQDPSQLSVLHQDLRLALNTTVAIGALCAGVLVLLRDTEWVRVVVGSSARARLAQLLAPVALIPVAFSAIANVGVRLGYYGPDVRMLLISELSACALLVLAFWAARALGRERLERNNLVGALDRSTVIICTPTGVIRYWSQACELLYGWTAAEAVGRNTIDLFSQETREGQAARQAEILRSGEWHGELEQRTKSGNLLWVASNWALQDGGPDGDARLVGTVSDITNLKLAKRSLRTSQERLMLAMGVYDLGIADIDVATDEVLVEQGLERIFGVAPGGLNGSLDKFRATLVTDDLPETLRLANAAIAARLPRQIDDFSIRRPDGEVRDLHGVRGFFYSPEGVHERTIGIYRDVTEERHAQHELTLRDERLVELRSELAHVSRLSTMSEMAAGFGHELNQPLTAIGTLVGALKIMLGDGGKPLDEVTRERVMKAANQAESQAVRAGEIVRRLRDFIARGEADVRPEDLASLIEDSVALAAPNAKSEEVDIRLELSPKAGRVLADRIQVQQILVNLIRNAMEAMRGAPAPHRLTIATSTRRDMVEVSVSDNGPGVAPEFAKELFSPFHSTKTTGMGVGLSICRRIVEAHGGRMWLEWSQSGADFRFTIPSGSEEYRLAE